MRNLRVVSRYQYLNYRAVVCLLSRLFLRREIRRALRREIRRAPRREIRRAPRREITRKSPFLRREISRKSLFLRQEMTRTLASGNGTQPSFRIICLGKWHANKFSSPLRREMARNSVWIWEYLDSTNSTFWTPLVPLIQLFFCVFVFYSFNWILIYIY